MREISESEILERLRVDNPWWETSKIDDEWDELPRRAYFEPFHELVKQTDVRRAVVLLGPRRIGKTVLIRHSIQGLLNEGVSPNKILYLSLDTPIYNKLRLERLLQIFRENIEEEGDQHSYVIFDEIQYLKDWEVHLKDLVDVYRKYEFVASGSAAAALRMKSRESGAGRFTEFMLPPLSFAEFLVFSGTHGELIVDHDTNDSSEDGVRRRVECKDIDRLNKEFVNYINFGGFPELVYSSAVRRDADRYIRADIIDKVILRDLPSLYGIHDIQELNSLFLTLALNTGQEISLDGLSQSSSVAKNTIKKYLEYLEASFLVQRVNRIDGGAKRFQRATHFKIYLTNPVLWSAMFHPVSADDEMMGHLAETAIFSQWFHDLDWGMMSYARWDKGEVDIVYVDPSSMKPDWAVEVKWSDRYFDRPSDLEALLYFAVRHEKTLDSVLVTTRTKSGRKRVKGVEIEFLPTALHCYEVGKNLISYARSALSDRYQLEMEI